MREFLPAGFERFRIDTETYDLSQGPRELLIADHRLTIVDVRRDLNEFDRLGQLAVIDPLSYRTYGEAGYVDLLDREEILLGRESPHSFDFSTHVSREHVTFEKRGNWVLVVDQNSLNGTYEFRLPGDKVDGPRFVEDTAPAVEDLGGDETYRVQALAAFSEASDNKGPNQDAVFVDQLGQSFGVFDGVGGAPGSERAAQIASSVAADSLREADGTLPRSLWHLAIQESLIFAHNSVLAFNPDIATTATVAKVFTDTKDGQPHIVIGSAGDSRAWLLRNGKLEHLTLDHAYSIPGLSESKAKLVQTTLGEVTDLSQLSDEERKAFARRNIITSHLGVLASPTVTISDFDVMKNDIVLLTTDGIHDNLTGSEILEITASGERDPELLVRSLVKAAKLRSRDRMHLRSKDDDITAAVMVV